MIAIVYPSSNNWRCLRRRLDASLFLRELKRYFLLIPQLQKVTNVLKTPDHFQGFRKFYKNFQILRKAFRRFLKKFSKTSEDSQKLRHFSKTLKTLLTIFQTLPKYFWSFLKFPNEWSSKMTVPISTFIIKITISSNLTGLIKQQSRLSESVSNNKMLLLDTCYWTV